MSDLIDIFNLDGEAFVTKTQSTEGKDLEFYKPYPEDGKDGVYKSLIRFLPNVADPKKSKIHKYYVYLKDAEGQGFSVDCPSTVGKKSVLKDIFWKLKNSHSAADQELAKQFSRKEDYYSLVQIVQDKNKPELEGKILIFKFGKKLNDMIEAQIKPEYGDSSNPFDLFNGKLFAVQVRKVGEWNNYDLCQFVGSNDPIMIDGRKMDKTPADMEEITKYLKAGPQNLASFDYKDWDENMTEKVMRIIKSTVPDGRLVNEIMSGVNYSKKSESPAPQRQAPREESPFISDEKPSTPSSGPVYGPKTSPSSAIFEELESSSDNYAGSSSSASSSSDSSFGSSLEDLYKDL
jgi:hypothetical protein